ncbi:MAG: hypothetical protein IPJ30_07210 [Acidobacteria bacterium]|nr:hypothetical protein [Acidobacteriota bacterium]
MSFLIDDEFDQRFLLSIEKLTQYINKHCQEFTNPKQLCVFLTTEDEFTALEKLKAFVSLIGLSEERLKRVVSLLRYRRYDDDFRTEWSVERISNRIRQDQKFMNFLVDFFLNGRSSSLGSEVPLFYMRNFKLKDPEFIDKLKDYKYVERILNDNEILGKYSNEVGAHVERVIKSRLDHYRETQDPTLMYVMQSELPLLNKNIDFLIPSVQNPIILIEASYNITTGSGQSKRADQLVEFKSKIVIHNANHKLNKIILVNYCDGFGWVARQNDLQRIYDASDFVLNHRNMSVLDDVLNLYYPRH